MKRNWISLFVLVAGIYFLARAADESPPPAAAPAAAPVSPPAAPAKRSAAELEKLVETIAIYPDPLIASILPASVYPLEIVQAARFVADTNNLAKLDEQPWDDNVKAVARVPQALKQMNDNLPWTIQLGEAFLAQDKDVMDAIQSLRMKAQKAGTLQTTDQQIVVVTNTVVETVVEQQPVIVTNTVVQIVPTNPEIVYVPTYVPSAVYYPPPTYVYDPYAPVVTFGAGIAVGIILANGCDWYHGGCYHGGYYGGYKHTTKIKVEGDVNVGGGDRVSPRGDRAGAGEKWQANQSRLNNSGARGTSPATQEARGWGSGTSAADKRPAASTGAAGNRPSTGAATARPSTTPSTGAARPASPSTSYNRPATTPSSSRPSTPSSPANRPSTPSTAARPAQSAPASRPATSQSVNRPSTSAPARSSSAFAPSGGGSSARSASSRGAASRSGGGGGGGGGARGGGGGGRR